MNNGAQAQGVTRQGPEARTGSRKKKYAVYKSRNPLHSQSRDGSSSQRFSEVAIHKLNDLFDFQHFLKDHVTSPSTHANDPEYTFSPRNQKFDPSSCFAPLDVSESSSSNVLGVPPPPAESVKSIEKSHNVLSSVNPTLMNNENQLFLHDLISGDIYEE